jgi:hypothetical protein
LLQNSRFWHCFAVSPKLRAVMYLWYRTYEYRYVVNNLDAATRCVGLDSQVNPITEGILNYWTMT